MPLKPVHQQLKHYHRYAGYDYARGASLFISLATEPRRRLFGDVIDGKMALNDLGREVDRSISFTFSTAPDMVLCRKKVLPDHCHFRFYLKPGHETFEAIGLINHAIGRFKSYTTKLYHAAGGAPGPFWQEGCHDWLCMNRKMIDAVDRYIDYNDLKWFLRHKLPGALKLYEPLKSPRLGQGEYWRGIGAVGLLGSGPTEGALLRTEAGALQGETQAPNRAAAAVERPMVSLRVSRRCTASDVSEVVRRITAKAGEFTVISGFISPGEREVLAALLARREARLVKVSPYALPHDYAPPVTLMPAIAEDRLAIIARGNSPEEISRAACLDYNARIIDIADKSAYALPGELRWLK